MTVHEAEVLVVGGGPAGLATAIAARLRGLEVDLLDRRSPPIDKPCGEGLMPSGIEALGELGVSVEDLPGRSFEGIRYVDGDVSAEGRFEGGQGRGIRRLVLHRALVDRALELGVCCHWGVAVEKLETAGRDGCEVHSSAGDWRSRWVVAADGLHSRLRALLGLDGTSARWPRFGVRRHYQLEPWSSFVEVYWQRGCEAYVTPVDDDLVGIAILWSGKKASFDELLSGFDDLRRRLENAPLASKDRGAGPFLQRVKARSQGRVALVGDAAGYVDALTGEGLGLAFHQALALARALEVGELHSYEADCRRIVRAPEALTKATLLLSRFPRLRPKVVRVLAGDSALFSRLLAVQNHDRDLWPSAALDLARLGGRLLLPG